MKQLWTGPVNSLKMFHYKGAFLDLMMNSRWSVLGVCVCVCLAVNYALI